MKRHSYLLLIAALMFACFLQNSNAAPGASQIARWKDNKTACFLLMFDDSMTSAYQVAAPEMMRRGMFGTFYVNPGKGDGWPLSPTYWESLMLQWGMVYGDHTWDHGDTTSLQQQDDEIRLCQEKIMSLSYSDGNPHLISYGQPGVGTWFDYGAGLTAQLVKYNLISRPAFIANEAPYTGINTIPALLGVADSAVTKKGMGYLIFHGLQRKASEGDSDPGFQDFWAFNKDVFRGALDGLKLRSGRGDLWITDHISYYKYQTERDNSQVLPAIVTAQQIDLTLTGTGTANVTLCDIPLTIRTEVPVAWKAAVVTQGVRQVSVPVLSGTIQYDAMPGAGMITVTESPLPVVTVSATVPEAYETGPVPGRFTISTTGTARISVTFNIMGTGTNGGLFTTGTNSGRYTIAARPVIIGSGTTSADVDVVPVPDLGYQGEQSVVLTINSGTEYAVGSGSSAVVTIHDRTDIPPNDWYLHNSQITGQDWNTKTTWWSQPTGGTVFSAYSRATISDRFHVNNYTLRTSNGGYPNEKSCNGNHIVLDGTNSKLSLAGVMYNSVMDYNLLPILTSYGGRIGPLTPNTLTQILRVTGTFNNQGTTTFSNGGNLTYPGSGLNLSLAKLTGTGEIVFTNELATSGTEGSTISNAITGCTYRGTIKLAAGTLTLKALLSSGSLTLAQGAAVVLSGTGQVGRLTVGSTLQPAGAYTAAQLNGMGVLFSGSGTLASSLLPQQWGDFDIGSPIMTGFATYSGTTGWSVYGGGTQISGTLDKFNFALTETSGSTPALMARVTSVQNTSSAARAGVMLRDSINSQAAFAALTVSPAGVITFTSRLITGTSAVSVQAGATVVPPVWLKVVSTGSTCTGYYSSDSTNWTQVASAAPSFDNTPLAGLAVCSGTNPLQNLSTFTGVAAAGAPPQFVLHPQSQAVTTGTTVILSGSATDVDSATYQWRKDSGTIAGGTSSTLTLTNVQTSDSGVYSLVASNAVFSATSNPATLTVNLPTFTISTSSFPAGSGTTSGSGVYQSGTSITVSATPASGYGFATWTEGGSPVGISSNHTFTITGNRTLVANFQPNNLTTWSSSVFTSAELANAAVSGKLADPDGDGSFNLLEYALGMKPKTIDRPPQQVTTVNGCLTLTYTRNKAATDLNFIVEVSSDMQTWSSDPASISSPVVQADDGYLQTIQVRDLIPSSNASRRFIRLRVTTP